MDGGGARRLSRDFAVAGGVTGAGQVVAFVAAAYVAARFGADWRTDAFYLALALPLFAAYVVREAVKWVLVPRLAVTRARTDERTFAREATGFLVRIGATAFVATALLAAVTPAVVGFATRGSDGRSRDLTLALAFELLPIVPLMCLGGVFSAVLNVHGRFGLASAAVGIEAAFRIGAIATLADPVGIHSLAIGSVGGAVASTLLLGVATARARLLGRPPGVLSRPLAGDRAGARLALIGGALLLLSPLVDRLFAATLASGSVTALSYAERIVTVPYALVGAGFFAVVLARWSTVVAMHGAERLKQELTETAVRLVMVLAPVAVLLVILHEEVVAVALERGEFGVSASATTSSVVALLALGLIPNLLVLLAFRAFLALHDSMTPAWVGVVLLGSNLVLNAALIGPLGLEGIALATSLAWTLAAAFAWVRLAQRLGPMPQTQWFRALGRGIVAVAACALGALVTRSSVSTGAGALPRLVDLLLPSLAGIALFAMTLNLLGGARGLRLAAARWRR